MSSSSISALVSGVAGHPLRALLLLVAAWGAIGITGLLLPRDSRLVRACAISSRRGGVSPGCNGRGDLSDVGAGSASDDSSAGPAGSAIPHSPGRALGLLSSAHRRSGRGNLHLLIRVLPRRRGHRAGPDGPAVSRLPCQHGYGDPLRRRLSVYGGVGDHGVEFVFSGHCAASYS